MKRSEINITLKNFEEAVRDVEKAKEIDPCKFSIQFKPILLALPGLK